MPPPHHRAFARINHVTKPQSQTIHSVVTRWDEGTNNHDHEYFPVADVLVLEAANADGEGVMLYRYTTEGIFCGDTWHASVQEAMDQARYEYGDVLGGWCEIPLSEADAVAYALAETRS